MGAFDNITGFFSGKTAKNAADMQAAGLEKGYGQASGLLGQGRDVLSTTAGQGREALSTNYAAALQPFMQNYQTGTAGTRALTDALGITGDPSQITARLAQSPGYQFQLQQGNENILRNASRTGSLASGGTNVDLLNYGQGLAGQTYQNYVNNLMPFLGAGQTAASGIANVNTGLGSGLAANYANLGSQLAGSYGTQANAAYGTETGKANAAANAELAKNTGVKAGIDLGMQVGKAAASAFGGPVGGALAGVGEKAFNAATDNFMGPGSFQPPKGYQQGGRPPIGEPAIVGERGPELFVPDQPGTVVPTEYSQTFMRFMRPSADVDQLARVSPEYEPASAERAREIAAQRMRMGVMRGGTDYVDRLSGFMR